MRPSPKGQIPAIARNSVDLPDPEGPERATFSPSASTRCFVSTVRLPSGRNRSTSSRSILGVSLALATRAGPALLSASAWSIAISKEFRRSTSSLRHHTELDFASEIKRRCEDIGDDRGDLAKGVGKCRDAHTSINEGEEI